MQTCTWRKLPFFPSQFLKASFARIDLVVKFIPCRTPAWGRARRDREEIEPRVVVVAWGGPRALSDGSRPFS